MRFVFALVLLHAANAFAASPIAIDMDGAVVLNTHADQVGIWVDSTQEKLKPPFVKAIRDLRLKSIRYGWQFGVFDEADPSSQQHSPADPNVIGYFTHQGRIAETIGPGGIAELLKQTDTEGFMIASTDGINYTQSQDAELASMSPDQRIAFYANRASDWARWGRDRRLTHFEIGNENDISGHGGVEGIIAPWSPAEYAKSARRILDAIKAANPEAHCGINGGLKDEASTRNWFTQILATDPSLAEDLDFLVAHKYEMWLDFETWQAHADWNFGSVSDVMLDLREKLFPKLPVHVTEIGSWKTGEIDHHYRALLMTEMLGNVYRHAAVEHVQVWPTRWTTEGGVFGKSNESELSPMGLGLKAYSRFARPILFANGAAGDVRYFASRDDAGQWTAWFVNHSGESRTLNCKMSHVQSADELRAWRVESPTEDPHASDTRVVPLRSVPTSGEGNQLAYELSLPPISATVVTTSVPR